MNRIKKNLSLITLIVLFVFIYSCNKSDDKNIQTDKQKTIETQNIKTNTDSTKLVKEGKFVCPMHPLMQSNEQIKCPICKMQMVSKADFNKQTMDEHGKMETNYAGKKDAVHFDVTLSVIKSTECSALIETALKSDKGILAYHIDILNKIADMYFDKNKTSKENIKKLISDAGFDADDIKANPDAANKMTAECK